MAPDSGWAGLAGLGWLDWAGDTISHVRRQTRCTVRGRLMQGTQCIRENGGRAKHIRDVQKGTGLQATNNLIYTLPELRDLQLKSHPKESR